MEKIKRCECHMQVSIVTSNDVPYPVHMTYWMSTLIYPTVQNPSHTSHIFITHCNHMKKFNFCEYHMQVSIVTSNDVTYPIHMAYWMSTFYDQIPNRPESVS